MLVSTREHISRPKTNDVSPFRKYIGRERYERLMCTCARTCARAEERNWKEARGEGISPRLASLSFTARWRGEDRFAVLKA